ncbi:glycosyltransferase [Pseudarthrobacter sp. J1763]
MKEAESRHDYHRSREQQEVSLTLVRLRALAEGLVGDHLPLDETLRLSFDESSKLPRVLFVTSNGAGMGHLTRCMAIARSGRESFQSHFVSLASSAAIVNSLGFEVLKFPSQKASSGISHREWNDRFSEFFDAVCRANRPDAIVFDGTWIYRGIHESARRHGIKMIWLRRGLWHDGASTAQIKDSKSIVDHLLVPFDIAAEADTGPVSRSEGTQVNAATLTTPADSTDRDRAIQDLGLDPRRRYVLVQLGAGVINDINDLRELVISEVLKRSPEVDIVLGLSPLSPDYEDVRLRVHVLRKYPIADYLQAFDFMVIAAGYNSVHESVRFTTPAIVIPNLETLTDNQSLRASEFERLGYGLAAITRQEIISALSRMLTDSELQTFRKSLESSVRSDIDSGEDAAQVIKDWLSSNG